MSSLLSMFVSRDLLMRWGAFARCPWLRYAIRFGGTQGRSALALILLIWAGAAGFGLVAHAQKPSDAFDTAERLRKEGNYQEAGLAFMAIAESNAPSQQILLSIPRAIQSARRTNDSSQLDAWMDRVARKHQRDWRVLHALAKGYMTLEHYGMWDGETFFRGHRRNVGELVGSAQRDRVMALRHYRQAEKLAKRDRDSSSVAKLYLDFAGALVDAASHGRAWKLQQRTDLAELPEFDPPYSSWAESMQGAPVDSEGSPIVYGVPASWDGAASDGDRWRWALARAASVHPESKPIADRLIAQWSHGQFGVQTMRAMQFLRDRGNAYDNTIVDDLPTLEDDETMARLANGVKRFKLAKSYQFVRIYRRLAEGDSPESENARWVLAEILLNRRQLAQAADQYRLLGKSGSQRPWAKRLAQIEGDWGRFESSTMKPAGVGATLEFRYRNAKQVKFTARRVDLERLLRDVKENCRAGRPSREMQYIYAPSRLNSFIKTDAGARLLGEEVASWQQTLDPGTDHFDRRVTISTPLQDPGAYLVNASMPDGNQCWTVVWLADLAIIKKQVDKATLYAVTDATTGHPVEGANVEFLGIGGRHKAWKVKNFAENSNADGFVMVDLAAQGHDLTWLAVARKGKRLAFLGFEGAAATNYDQVNVEPSMQQRAFAITDRPVYRPGQEVHFKLWLANAKYGMNGPSQFADRSVHVEIHNPKGETIETRKLTADAFGGVESIITLPDDATLGQYRIFVKGFNSQARPTLGGWRGKQVNATGATFRVEEYKKPEFEVTVDAPTRPIALGDSFSAKVTARYYFGQPVADATIRYRVHRTTHASDWFPIGPWDWLYRPGYWWSGGEYSWYPGWGQWGCARPGPWFRPIAHMPPEVVAHGEAKLRPDGTFDITVDTQFAKQSLGDRDHNYRLEVEVVDASRRTIVGQGRVIVARQPFRVYVWGDRGFYTVGDTIAARFAARTVDGKPVQGDGTVRLLKIGYKNGNPIEEEVQAWELSTDTDGESQLKISASESGQYRLSYTVTDQEQRTIQGGHLLTVMGRGLDGSDFRFNDIELLADRQEYRPGDSVKLQINTNQKDSFVLLFLRPVGSYYKMPKPIRIQGKSTTYDFKITRADMPNIFVEAVTVSHGELHSETLQICVPPEEKVMTLDVHASAKAYQPGEDATIELQLTDANGDPLVGNAVVAVYDKSTEYISGGSNVPDIRSFFWSWKREHYPTNHSSLHRYFRNIFDDNKYMADLGVFGSVVLPPTGGSATARDLGRGSPGAMLESGGMVMSDAMAMPSRRGQTLSYAVVEAAPMAGAMVKGMGGRRDDGSTDDASSWAQPNVRTQFADTAYWNGTVTTDAQGKARVEFAMPENLTTWRVRVWSIRDGTRVAEAATDVVTRKNLIVRLQSPRFFVDTDQVVLSANVHNYLETAKDVRVRLELDGGRLQIEEGGNEQTVRVDSNGEARVDWRVKAVGSGSTTIRMVALTDEESDAMQMEFPVHLHAMVRQQAIAGTVGPDSDHQVFSLTVPEKRQVKQTRLEVRYSPSLAAAMLDAIPYLVDYPYGCTEQTLNRFLPAAITRDVLKRTGVDLERLERQTNNLNAQELGDPELRRKLHQSAEPVFNSEKHAAIVKQGVQRLTEMQLADGGWGWFSGPGEHSSAHTTAWVIRGLHVAESHGVALVPGVMERGMEWLHRFQQQQLEHLDNYQDGRRVDRDLPAKNHADNLDALVYSVLTECGKQSSKMRDRLYRDRTHLSAYSLAMFGVALQHRKESDKVAMVVRNLKQSLQIDDENDTAYLNLQPNMWWHWYGSSVETQAYFLKLLVATEPDSSVTRGVVKYLLNNRRHGTYWNSTRDTALVLEAFGEFLLATDELNPDMTIEVWVDGTKRKTSRINRDNLFTFDGTLVLEGDALSAGPHRIEIRRKGTGAVYFNGYMKNFTLEDSIPKAGLELRVERHYFRLVPEQQESQVAGDRGQLVDQRREKFRREPLESIADVKSGDRIEVRLDVESKNDYEYILVEDRKPACCEPVEQRSGYSGNGLGAYVEYRDDRVALFVRDLPRGKRSLYYQMRAETPGKFSALPTIAQAMYAPELRGNSDENKLRVSERPKVAPESR